MKRVVQRYVSLAEGAVIVGVSVDTLRRRIRSGELPAVRHGRLIRVRPEDLYYLFQPMVPAGIAATDGRLPAVEVGGRRQPAAARTRPSPWR